jgi:VCBS repeat-containing protein
MINRLASRLLSTASVLSFEAAFAPEDGRGRRSGNRGYFALEPRVLFDGAAVDTLIAVSENPEYTEPTQDFIDTALLDALSASAVEVQAPREVVVIDSAIADYDQILAVVDPDAMVVVLDPTRDGVEQIAEAVSSLQNVEAIHIFSHGRSGTLDLGSTKLTEASMAGRHADEMAIIRAVLAEQADILIYGCDFAAGSRGESAVVAFAAATGADVAASKDLTGAADLGGNWVLEDVIGDVDEQAISATGWNGLLDGSFTPANLASGTGIGTANVTYTGADGNVVSLQRLDGQGITAEAGLGAGLGRQGTDWQTGDTESYRLTFQSSVDVADIRIGFLNNNIDGEEELYNIVARDALGNIIPGAISFTNLIGGAFVGSNNGNTNGVAATFGSPGGAATAFTIHADAASLIKSIEFTRQTYATGQTPGQGAFGLVMSNLSYALPDVDGDGVVDATDIDDDNDGILDTREGYVFIKESFENPVVPNLNANNIVTSSFGAVTTQNGSEFNIIKVNGTPYFFGADNAADGNQYADIRSADDYPIYQFVLTTGGSATISADYSNRNPESPNYVPWTGKTEILDASFNVVATGNTLTFNTSINPETWFKSAVSVSLSAGTYYFRGFVANYGHIDNINIEVIRDADGDGKADHLDIDSDNDGITDNVEAQTTAGYVAPSGTGAAMVDTDNDGMDNAYDATDATGAAGSLGLTPVNTDGGAAINDTTPDYLDANSDNDALSDAAERGAAGPTTVPAANAADTDGDGLKDVFEGGDNSDGFDVNDENLTSTTFNLADTDNDTAANGAGATPLSLDLDYRDNAFTLDTDSDGTLDVTDIDDDNDGILDTAEGNTPVFSYATNWAISGNQATGTVNGVGFTYTSNTPITTTAFFADHAAFPAQFNVPNINPSIQNVDAGLKTLTFSQPVTNPVIVIGSIGAFFGPGDSRNTTVPIQFNSPVEVLFSDNVVVNSPTQISGTEGRVVVRFVGTFTSVSFNYLTPEFFASFAFGVQTFNNVDTDADGLFDHLDIDSDNDGITDNVEAQATSGYVAPTGIGAAMVDTDNDGLDDAYDATDGTGPAGSLGLTPVNTDGADLADYLDLNSDNDAMTDAAERGTGSQTTAATGLSSATTDADGDGLFDVFEGASTTDGFDVNDENLTGTTFNLADTDNDTAANGAGAVPLTFNLDYRDNVTIPPRLDLDTNPVPTNIVTNSDFSAGLTGWTITPSSVMPGFGVGAGPGADHTTGTGNLVVIDTGFPNGFTGTIMSQTINVIAGHTYTYEAWMSSLRNFNTPTIELLINGAAVASGSLNVATPGVWQRLAATYVATTTGPVTIAFRDTNPTGNGNDFLVDDITFTDSSLDITTGYETTFTEDGAAVAIAAVDSTITDSDSANMVSATIVLTNAQASDVMSISGVLPGAITSAIDTSVPGQVTISLTGSATKADYQTAIEAVRFANTSAAPNTTDRIVNVTVNDGVTDSNTAVAIVHVVPVNDPPVTPDVVVTTNQNVTISVPPETGLLANTVDPDGGVPTVTGFTVGTDPTIRPVGVPFTVPNVGDITINADGSYLFDPQPAYTTPALPIGIIVSDGIASARSLLTISVNATGDTDGDGVNDVTDIDDDNDGILDTVEAGLLLVPGTAGVADQFDPNKAGFYQVLNNATINGVTYPAGQLFIYNVLESTYSPVGTGPGFQINAVGYDTASNLLYGIASSAGVASNGTAVARGDLVAIDRTGEVFRRAATSVPNQFANAADVANGKLYVKVNTVQNSMLVIDLTTFAETSITLSASTPALDLANINGVFYGINTINVTGSGQATMVKIDTNGVASGGTAPTTTVTVTGFPTSLGSPANGGVGATFVATNSTTGARELYLSMNSTGDIYRIDGYTTSTPTAVRVLGGIRTDNNDGASSPLAPPPLFANLPDTDGDGIKDHLDIDADNDGITDNVEAQTTAGYIAPSGTGAAMVDADRDGLDDRYDTSRTSGAAGSLGLTPVNSDAGATTPDAVADYLDADSDNDGRADITERGGSAPTSVTSTVDTDQDGLLDIFEAGSVSDGFDVNDSNLDAANVNFLLGDVDNDTAANGAGAVPLTRDLDYRDASRPPVLDLDNNDSTNSTGAGLGANYEATYIENAPGIRIADTDFTLSDPDNDITELTVILTDGQIGDTINFPSVMLGGITAAVNPVATLTAPGVMTLTFVGTAATTTADWQAVLNAITFLPSTNNVHNPDPSDRHITVQASDATGSTTPLATATIHVTPENDLPTLDLDDDNSSGINSGNVNIPYTENGTPVPLHSGVVTTDLDDTNYETAVVTHTNPQPGDQLYVNGALVTAGSTGTVNGIAYVVSTVGGQTVINFSGSATKASYDAALESVSFASSSENPSTVVRNVTFVVNDGLNNSPTRTAFITVTPVNDAPIPINPASDPTVPANAMPPKVGSDAAALVPFNVKPFFSDPDNTAAQLTISLDPATTPTWMSLDANGNIVGTPPRDASQNTNTVGGTDGVYTIKVIATDPSGLTGETTVTYTISNPPPDAKDDAFGKQENAPALFGNVFGGNPTPIDSDPDGDTFSVTAVGGVGANLNVATAGSAGGTFKISSNGTMVFQDNGDFEDLAVGETRDTTITYTITDADGGTDTATVTVTVLGSNDGPVVVAGSEIPNKTGVDNQTITPINAAAAFNDVDATDVLTYTATGLPLGLSIDEDTGLITGTIDNSASQVGNTGAPTNGVYTIVVTAKDPSGATVTDTFTYTVTNPPPDAKDDRLTVGEDAVLTGLNVKDNNGNSIDSDPDGDALTVTQVNGLPANVGQPVDGSTGGSFTIGSTGAVSFDPQQDFQYLDAGQTATTTVTYQLSDGEGGFDTATVTVTVTGANDAPIPVDPTNPTGPVDPNDYLPDQTGIDGDPLTPLDTSIYFADPDTSDVLTFSSPDLPSWMLIDPVTGVITGTPPLDASTGGPNGDGVYPITIVVTDGDETFETTLEYNIGNLPPDAVNDTVTANEDTILTVPVATGLIGSNDTDGDGDPLSVTQLNGASLVPGTPVTLPSGAILTLKADGSFDYDPNGAFDELAAGETGTDSFTYQITDGDGLFDTATVNITINGANDVPVAVDDGFTAVENGPAITGNVLPSNGNGPDSDVDATDVLTVTQVNGVAASVGQPIAGSTGGLFTIDDRGALTFVSNRDFEDLDDGESRTTTVTYTIDDGNGGTDTATVTVVVAGANDAPVPVDPDNPGDPDNPIPADPDTIVPVQNVTDGQVFPPGSPLVDLGPYIADPDGEPVTFTTASPLPEGLTLNPDGTITGTVDPDASQGGDPTNPGLYVITVEVSDGTTTTPITVRIDVSNPPPVAEPDTASVGEDAAEAVGNVITPVLPTDVADVDTGPDSDILTVVSAVQGANPITIDSPFTTGGGGVLTLKDDGSYTFIPGTAYNGLDVGETATETVTYTISDGNGGTDTATLTITINGSNDAPVPVDPMNPGPDPENPIPADPDTIVPVQTVTDGQDFTTTPLVDLGPYIADPDGEPVTFTTTSPLPVGLTLNPDGTVTGVVDPNASQGGDPANPGVYVITVEVSDGTTTTPITLTIDVSNPPPIAVDDTGTVGEDAPLVVGNVISGPGADSDTAPDSDLLSVVSAVQGANPITVGTPFTTVGGGVLTLNDDGSYTFEPGTAYNGLDVGETATETITYTISDGNGGSDTATLTITINGSNDAPVPVDPSNPGDPDNPIVPADPLNIIPDVTTTDGATPPVLDVKPYFVDPDGEPLVITAAGLPPGLMLNPDGTITGKIDKDASQGGPYPVTLTATDPDGATTITTVTYTISNLPPVAVDDTGTVGEDAPEVVGNVITGPGADADTAPDSDPLTVVSAVQGTTPITIGTPFTTSGGGVLTLNGEGDYTFIPGTSYNGLDAGETATETITYIVDDGNGGTDTATLTITINGSNDAPVPVDPNNPGDPDNPIVPADPLNIIPDVTTTDGATPPVLDVKPYFVDPDGEPLVITATGLPPGLTLNPDGTITGKIDKDASQGGLYTVTLTATDPDGATTITTVTYTITNLPPVAVDDVAPTTEDVVASGNVLTDPATGDADTAPDSDPLIVTGVTGGALGSPIALPHGTLVLDSFGNWTFTPNAAANALPAGVVVTDQVTYTVSDGNGGTDTATLTIEVTGVNDTPVAADLPDKTNFEGETVTVPTAQSFADPDGDPLTFTATNLPPGLAINPTTGVISGTLPPGASAGGPFTVVVTASDGKGGTITADFVYTIKVPVYASAVLAESETPKLIVEETVLAPITPILLPVIDQIGRSSSPYETDYRISRTVEGLRSLNSLTELDRGDGVITRLVEWAGHQGLDASWMHALVEEMERGPYLGDDGDLVLERGGEDVLRVRTLVQGDALYVGIDELGEGVRVIDITRTNGKRIPEHIARIDKNNLVINIKPDGCPVKLRVTAREASGQMTYWDFEVDPISSEVLDKRDREIKHHRHDGHYRRGQIGT